MAKVAIYGRSFDDSLSPHIQRLFNTLLEHGAEALIYEPFYDYLNPRLTLPENVTTFTSYSELAETAKYLFSIGGDGTLLDSTTLVRDSGIPIIGINTGRLGYLSSISLDEMEMAIEAILHGHYEIDQRDLLKLETDPQLFGNSNFALNELTIHKKDTSAMITIHTFVDGEFLNSYWADGLIISTATGSTAYSLSCGGPIILPGSNNFVVTPIAPHNLNVRPMVLPSDSKITLKLEGRSQFFLVSLDSRSESTDAVSELHILKNNFRINLLRLKSHSYLRTLRTKLNWGLDQRN